MSYFRHTLVLIANFEDHEVELVSNLDLLDYCEKWNEENPDATPIDPSQFAISLPEGDEDMEDLFEKCKITHKNFDLWVDDVDRFDDLERAALFWLLDSCNYSDAYSAVSQVKNANIVTGSGIRQAEEMFHEMYDVPDAVRAYINYDAYLDDLVKEGTFDEFDYNGITYTITNADQL